ncbi:MAG: hypothetical protein M1830_008247 [Pleopsidium flavum]|nr:MAG: hypothetical protein M1830_008247 [Pleopsidium flavum]
MNSDPNISSPSRSHAAQLSERPTNQPQPIPNSQPDNHNHEEKTKDATTAAAAARSAKVTSKYNNAISFTLNWICVVLTIAATISFGIWAPLSYRATADGNRKNDKVQSAQSTVLASMQSQLGAMGQLAMAVTVCSDFVGDVPMTSLISYLASNAPPGGIPESAIVSSSPTSSAPPGASSGSAIVSSSPTPSTSQTATVGSPPPYSTVSAGPTASPTASPSNTPNLSHLPVEAALGIVFGILTLLRLVAGFFAWRYP